MNNNRCKNCGTYLPRHSSSRRQYCNDLCRLQANRAKKATPKKAAAMKAEKYDRLVLTMRDSIASYEKRAAHCEQSSKEASRPTGERLAAADMWREYQAIANELKRLLDYNERIAALYEIDPINYD